MTLKEIKQDSKLIALLTLEAEKSLLLETLEFEYGITSPEARQARNEWHEYFTELTAKGVPLSTITAFNTAYEFNTQGDRKYYYYVDDCDRICWKLKERE